MSKQLSPFAALTGAEKQIRWLEYQSIRLPYVELPLDSVMEKAEQTSSVTEKPASQASQVYASDRPQPPPEVPRVLPPDYQKTRHAQYDAVIARLKQAELQSKRYSSKPAQQEK